MEYTQNYALRKPGLNEYANVGDLNYNSDKIDSQMKKNQDVDGEVYDPTSTSANAYEAGDYVINPDDGLMYVCNGTTYGIWDATKWDHTTEFEELQKAMASGGESELANLHDVEITTPTDGQALLYDPTSSKWHNSDLPDADVTKTASGNPIEFTDGADAPLVKCVTQITGSQDLHGQDKPWVGGAGKNLIDDETLEIRDVTGTGIMRASLAPVQLSAGTYTLSYASKSPTLGLYITIIDDNYASTAVNDSPTSFTITSTKNVMIRSSAGATSAWDVVDIQLEKGSQATSYAPYSNICPITAYNENTISVVGKNRYNPANTLNLYIGYSGGIYTINSNSNAKLIYAKCEPNTAYMVTKMAGQRFACGYTTEFPTAGVEVLNAGGVPTGTVRKIETGSDAKYIVAFVYLSTADTVTAEQMLATCMIEKGENVTTYEPYVGTTHTTTYPDAIYRGSEDCVNGTETHDIVKVVFDGSNDEQWGRYTTGSASAFTMKISIPEMKRSVTNLKANYLQTINTGATWGNYDGWISCTADGLLCTGIQSITTVEDWRTYLSNHNLEVVYELGTPTTSSVTPTNLPIKSLFGFNHIESSTGDMEIEYFPAKEQPLIDLIKNDTVDTQEILYIAPDMNDTEITIDLTAYDEYVFYANDVVISSQIPQGNSFPKVVFTQLTANNSIGIYGFENCSCIYTYANGKLTYSSGRGGYKITMIVGIKRGVTTQYITPSQQRSLAKSAPQEEVKEEQVEELKEEPTEEIKEEPEEVKEEPVEEVKEEVKEEETKDPETNEEEKR